MDSSQASPLVIALEATVGLLRKHGDRGTADRLDALLRRVRLDDAGAILAVISEATGGMGSLNDRYLCVENGDAIQAEEVESANERLRQLVRQVEICARGAASARR